MRLRALAISSIALYGCATAPSADCAAVDWRLLGFNDGLEGAPVDKVRGAAACGNRAESPVEAAMYLDGWGEGVSRYCDPANGFALGASGKEYNGVCNGSEASAFSAAFRAGEELHMRREALAQARRSLGVASRDLWTFRRRIAEIEAMLLSTDIDAVERRDLRAEHRALSAEEGETARLVAERERDVEEARRAHDLFMGQLADQGFSPGVARPAAASY